jgi:hypothetical protein
VFEEPGSAVGFALTGSPQDVENAALDGAFGEILGSEAFAEGGAAVDFAADIDGNSEGNGAKSGSEPQNGKESAAAFGAPN